MQIKSTFGYSFRISAVKISTKGPEEMHKVECPVDKKGTVRRCTRVNLGVCETSKPRKLEQRKRSKRKRVLLASEQGMKRPQVQEGEPGGQPGDGRTQVQEEAFPGLDHSLITHSTHKRPTPADFLTGQSVNYGIILSSPQNNGERWAWLRRCGVAVSTIGSRSLLLAAATRQVRRHQ